MNPSNPAVEAPLKSLVEALWVKSKEPGMSITKVAAKCDVSESYIYKLRDGSCKANITKFLQAIVREYPDLKPLVFDYITGGDGQHGDEPGE